MTEPTPQYTTNGRMQSYQLTEAEVSYLKRFRHLFYEAKRQQRPVVLTVIFENNTASFYDGNPSGRDKLTS